MREVKVRYDIDHVFKPINHLLLQLLAIGLGFNQV